MKIRKGDTVSFKRKLDGVIQEAIIEQILPNNCEYVGKLVDIPAITNIHKSDIIKVVPDRKALKKFKKWFYTHFPDIFRFHLDLLFFSLYFELFTRCCERDCYYILRFAIKLWKWQTMFELGETSLHMEKRYEN